VVEVVRGSAGYVYRLGQRELDDPQELTICCAGSTTRWQGAFVRVSDGAPFRMAAAAVQACKTPDSPPSRTFRWEPNREPPPMAEAAAEFLEFGSRAARGAIVLSRPPEFSGGLMRN
jgi:hypothetical protein